MLKASDARQAVMVLAHHTGWALSELLELEDVELMAWLDVLPRESNS